MFMVMDPKRFGVVVASNLFADILTDLGAAIMGGMGFAPSANLNPERTFPSMFEPIHGSAPDIAGQGKANPIGSLWSSSMMLDHLGHPEWAAALMKAIERVMAEAIRAHPRPRWRLEHRRHGGGRAGGTRNAVFASLDGTRNLHSGQTERALAAIGSAGRLCAAGWPGFNVRGAAAGSWAWPSTRGTSRSP